jgi:hypothetical protein
LFYCFALLYFTCIVLSKTQKIRILDSCFYLFALSFAKMSNPEVEVRSFK